MNWIKTLLFAILTIINYTSFAHKLDGTVTTQDQNPIQFVTATLTKASNNSVTANTLSDAKGYFVLNNIPQGEYILNLSYLGFKTRQINLSIRQDTTLSSIVLTPDVIGLTAVTVKGERKIVKIENGAVTTKIEGSVLAKEHHTEEVLKKIPGIEKTSNGKLSVIGLGTPIIYINGRKTNSQDELDRISPENIRSIQLITNPGAQYDASVSAVIQIKTKRLDEGWMARAHAEIYSSRRVSQNESINLNYQKGESNTFGSYMFDFLQQKTIQDMLTEIDSDTLWSQESYLPSKLKVPSHHFQLGTNTSLSHQSIIGIKYDGMIQNINLKAPSTTDIFSNHTLYTHIDNPTTLDDHTQNHHINLFGDFKLNSQWQYNLYGDYVCYNSNRDQWVKENATLYTDTTLTNNNANFDLYGLRTFVTIDMKKYGNLVFGYEFSDIIGTGLMDISSESIESTHYKNKELKNAPFMDYSLDLYHSQHKSLQLSAGVRYEQVQYRYTDYINPNNNLRRTYKNAFPNAGIVFHHRDIYHTFSFAQRVQRPNFEMLNGNVYYNNRFNIQMGNPLLTQQIDYNLQYQIKHKKEHFNIIYKSQKDFIGYFYYSNPENNSQVISTWKNFDNRKLLIANLNQRIDINDIIYINATASVVKPFFKVYINDKKTYYNKPQYKLVLDSYYETQSHWLFNASYSYSSAHDLLYFRYQPQHFLDLSIKKSFFNDQLAVDLYGKNLLNKYINQYDGRIDNIHFAQKEDQDMRNGGISIVYTFNNYHHTYKGKNAAPNEINRL